MRVGRTQVAQVLVDAVVHPDWNAYTLSVSE